MKRIKEPPAEFFRFQRFYNCDGKATERCVVCGRLVSTGIHDLLKNLIYCMRHGAGRG